jgi:hypothetical protein
MPEVFNLNERVRRNVAFEWNFKLHRNGTQNGYLFYIHIPCSVVSAVTVGLGKLERIALQVYPLRACFSLSIYLLITLKLYIDIRYFNIYAGIIT